MSRWFATIVHDKNTSETGKLTCAAKVGFICSRLEIELSHLKAAGPAEAFLEDIRELGFTVDTFIQEKQDEELIPMAESRPPVVEWHFLVLPDLDFQPPGLKNDIVELCRRVEAIQESLEGWAKCKYYRHIDTSSDLLIELGSILQWPAAELCGLCLQNVLGKLV